MKRRNSNSVESKYWLLVLSIICLIFMLLSAESNTGITGFIASYTVMPMQKGINSVGVFMRDFIENFDTLEELHEENDALQEKVNSLTMEIDLLQQNTYELERLQELYNLDANTSEYEKIGANVIAKDTGNWFSTFTIDKGSQDGIAVDMNVIADAGLVGIVTKVGENWATVRSIIDDSSNVSAMVVSSGDICTVQGDLTLMQDGVIYFNQLLNNDNVVEVGDELVTSYISSKYVQGLSIGVITYIEVDSNNLTRSGYITTTVDFTQLQEVLVITQLKDTGGDDDET